MEKVEFGFGYNRGVFSGKLVSGPVMDHEIKDKETGELIRTIYKLKMSVVFENKNKTVTDESVLPFLVSDDQLEKLGEFSVGDLMFIKARWRAFNRRDENDRNYTYPVGTVTHIEKVETLPRTQNKIELHGYLQSKIFKVEFDENGKIKTDENGRLIPVLDEEGNKIPWTRRNNENQQVNDVVLLVKNERILENGEIVTYYRDYIPAIGYGAVARQICDDIETNQKVKARGYVRQREKNGYPGEYVYEVVVTRITALDEEGNAVETKDHSYKPRENDAEVENSGE